MAKNKKWQASFNDELNKVAGGNIPDWMPFIGTKEKVDYWTNNAFNLSGNDKKTETETPTTPPAETNTETVVPPVNNETTNTNTNTNNTELTVNNNTETVDANTTEEGPTTPAADDVISNIENNDNNTTTVEVPGEDGTTSDPTINLSGSDTPAADSVINDIGETDMNTFQADSSGYSTEQGTYDEFGTPAPLSFTEAEGTPVTEDNMPTTSETPTETTVGDPNTTVTENQVPTEDTSPTTDVNASDVTPIANETVTADNEPGTTPAADALPKSHNDWGRATKDFTASEGASYGSLSEAIKHRGTLDKGSDEYMAVQSDINRAYGKTNRSSDYYKGMKDAPTTAPDALTSAQSDAVNTDIDTSGLNPSGDVPISDGATDGSGATSDDAKFKWEFGKPIQNIKGLFGKKSSVNFIKDIKANRK